MQFTSYLEDKRLTVALTGEIDHHCAKDYIEAIATKIEIYNPKLCVLDFRDVSFIDSSGIAVAINAMRCIQKIGGKLILDGVGSQPLKVLRTSGIDKLIEIKEAIL